MKRILGYFLFATAITFVAFQLTRFFRYDITSLPAFSSSDKTVLIGTLHDPSDFHLTPVDARMPGVLIHAIMTDNYLSGRSIREHLGFLKNTLEEVTEIKDFLSISPAVKQVEVVSEAEGVEEAFKKAGVKSVLMTLWDVSDAYTNLIMQLVYLGMAQGSSPREAYDAGTRKFREICRNSGVKEDWLWAGFVLLD